MNFQSHKMNVIAIDVGTTSVRLAIISFEGDDARDAYVLGSQQKNISHKQNGNKFEQKSAEIWQAICECSNKCIKELKLDPRSIQGIGFSATCSLVIDSNSEIDSEGNNVIMWLDHRAVEQAQAISSSHSKALNQFGGACSPEFSLSKLIWLKENQLSRVQSSNGLFELPDWLVFKCIGSEPASCPRSLCCVACKWGYDVNNKCHCDIIESLDTRIKAKIGDIILEPGTVAGFLSFSAAKELGLYADQNKLQNKENFEPLRIVVGTSLIDAHSGMLAMLSVPLKDYTNSDQDVESTLCSLAGTSSCHMLLSKERNFTSGIWGPYKNVVLKDYHLLEAGQSLTGKLIETVISHHEDGKARLSGGEKMYDIITNLNDQLLNSPFLGGLHILPTFHGNRSPLANPRLKGGVYGLTAEGSKSLLEYYAATVESIVYETKFIIERLGIKLNNVLVSGGLMKNTYYMQTLADVLQCNVVKMSIKGVDFMVMGSGLVARHAALQVAKFDIRSSIESLTAESIKCMQYQQLDIKTYSPDLERSSYHIKNYLCYKEFVEFSKRVDEIMNHS